MSQFKDVNGTFFIRNMLELVQTKGEGYVDYSWPRPGSDQPVPKTSYALEFAPGIWWFSADFTLMTCIRRSGPSIWKWPVLPL